MITQCPYLVLGVLNTSNDSEIRVAYQQKLKQFPPEQDEANFQQVTGAYELIRNEESRARLKLFGRDLSLKFSDLVPESQNRQRIPLGDWLQDIRKVNHD